MKTAKEYHAERDRISASKINAYAKRGPNYWRAKFMDQTIVEPDIPAFVLGRLTHCMVLEPTEVHDRYVVAPDCDRRTKEGKAAYADFQAQIESKSMDGDPPEIVSQQDFDLADAMHRAVLGHDFAGEICTTDQVGFQRIIETPILFDHCGMPCKALPDMVLPDAGLIVDLKTISGDGRYVGTPTSPQSFLRQIESLGYHRQAQFYREACKAQYGAEFDFYFIVVDTKPPHDVAVYRIGKSLLDIAAKEIESIIGQISERMATSRWQPPWGRGLMVLEASKYYAPFSPTQGISDYEQR